MHPFHPLEAYARVGFPHTDAPASVLVTQFKIKRIYIHIYIYDREGLTETEDSASVCNTQMHLCVMLQWAVIEVS